MICMCDIGHFTHFQERGDNSKVEGGILQNQYTNKAIFYFHFDVFIFENKVARENGNYTAN